MTEVSTSAVPTGVRVQAQGLGKSYGPRQVLQGTQLQIEPGEFVAIVGRSGCGKSTLLRLVAGLEPATQGRLLLDGKAVQGLSDNTRIMFQEARLLPWRRVLDNVALGLPESGQAAAAQVLEQVGLGDRLQEWPARLSGGQRQRVALARALVHQPQLLLLDEPLGALDALTRIEMHELIENLWKAHGFTALLVTHDVQEAVALADRVILIEDGAIALDERIDLLLAKGGRDATTIFLQRNIGDVLVTFESEVISVDNEFGAGKVDAVHPSISIVAENPVAVVERTVAKKGTAALAKAYLDYLYSDEAQEIAAKHALRPRNAAILKKYASTFKPIQLFTVNEVFGSMADAQKVHFNDGGQFDKLYTVQ